MFQRFDVTADPSTGPARLTALRELMAREGLEAMIVPRSDRFQGEYVAPADERLAWLTGFTGSAGFCAVTREEAGVFIDGRYRVQVRSQVAPVFTPVNWPETKLADWLLDRLTAGERVGFDPWLHTVEEIEKLRDRLGPKGVGLVPIDNPVDRLWTDRPAPPDAPFTVFPEEIAGESHGSKRARIAAQLREAGERAVVLTLPDSIAWLLNIRGGDVDYNPVPHAYAVLHEDGRCDLYCREGKAQGILDHLGPEVRVHPENVFIPGLDFLPSPTRLDPRTAPEAIFQFLTARGITVSRGQDPCLLPRRASRRRRSPPPPRRICATAPPW
jgi:Xaa-Pro aminopeptidase